MTWDQKQKDAYEKIVAQFVNHHRRAVEAALWELLAMEHAPAWLGLFARPREGVVGFGDPVPAPILRVIEAATERDFDARASEIAIEHEGGEVICVRRDGQWIVPVGHA